LLALLGAHPIFHVSRIRVKFCIAMINRALRERIIRIRENFSNLNNLAIFISYLTKEDMKSSPKDMKEEY